MRIGSLVQAAAWLSLTAAAPLSAQEPVARDSSTRRLSVPLLGVGFGVGTLAASSFDARWQRTIQGSGPQASGTLRSLARVGNDWGSPVAIIAAGSLWLGSRVLHDTTGARLGGRAIEGLVLSGIVTGVVKGLAGRARPYASPGQPDSWAFGRGISDGAYQSFPSGHATAAFAVASAITAQLQQDGSRAVRWAGPSLYGLAAITAFARTYTNQHWLSDVAAGAAVGTLSGLVVVRWNASHAGNQIDRWLIGR